MHFSVAVFTEPGGKSVEELLAPYQNDKWDCWDIGGGWRGRIKNDSAIVKEIDFASGQFCTFAVVTPDGKWCQQGQWGISSEDHDDLDWLPRYKERFIDKAQPDWALTIVDCHI